MLFGGTLSFKKIFSSVTSCLFTTGLCSDPNGMEENGLSEEVLRDALLDPGRYQLDGSEDL